MSDMEKVIENDLCNGCGNCSYLYPDTYKIQLDDKGKFSATILNQDKKLNLSTTCPFSSSSKNENEISSNLYKDTKVNGFVGRYIDTYAGYINNDEIREQSTSGGIINFLSSTLLKRGVVDGVIHVKKSKETGLFEYQISTTESDVYSSGKSAYYPVSPYSVLDKIRNSNKKYVFVGLPCMVKSIRLLSDNDEDLKQKIVFTIGLVCGHLKTKGYADYFIKNMDENPEDVTEFDFRYKLKEGGASTYAVKLKTEGHEEKVLSTRKLRSSNWQYNAFRYPCCNLCDDVFAETADVTVGDAWIQPYISMNSGASVIVVRNSELNSLLLTAQVSGSLTLDKLSLNKTIRSQLGGLRDRREGLAYRLFNRNQNSLWSPEKRVSPRNIYSMSRRKIYLLRMFSETMSHEAYKEKQVDENFDTRMSSIYNEIDHFSKRNRLVSSLAKLLFLFNPKNKA